MVAIASDIQITASLIDDYLLTTVAPVGPNPSGRFLAVQDPSAQAQWASLLSVDSSGDDLMLFTPDPSSPSGWSTATTSGVPVPSGATGEIARLAAFAQAGTTHALAYFPVSGAIGNGAAATWMQWSATSGWTTAALVSSAEDALGYTFQTDTYVDAAGNAYLYGVTGNMQNYTSGVNGAFFLVGFDPTANSGTGAWNIISECYVDEFVPAITTGAAFRLLPTGNGGINVVWIDGDMIWCRGATLASPNPGSVPASLTWSDTGPSSFASGLTGLTVSAIVPLPGDAGADNLLLVDGTGTLYLIQDYTQPTGTLTPLTGTLTPLTGLAQQPAGAVTAAAGVDGTGNLRVLVTETTTQMLWILRQSGTSGTAPTFDPWVQLGNIVSAIAAPASMAGGPELFLADTGLTAYHMTQNLTDLTWSTREIAAPAASTATPTNIAGTSMNLTVVDANQLPVADALIAVTSDQPAVLVVNGVSYPVGPGMPQAQIQADGIGQACVLIETTTLSMPPLLFKVTNTDGSTAQRSCQGDKVQVKSTDMAVPQAPASVASRLAGLDPNQPLNASALENNIPPLLDTQYTDQSDAVSSITNAGQWLLGQSVDTTTNTLSLDNVAVKHWSIDFGRDGAAAKFHVLSEAEGLAARQHAEAQTAVGSIFSKIFGDVANFFKHAWQNLQKITVTIGKELTVMFYDIENHVQSFFVNTVREAGQALETIFSRIVQGAVDAYDAVKNAINWLKQLFEWDDILITHRVIKAAVTSSLTAAAGATGTAQTFVKAKFSTLQGDVNDFFASLDSSFLGGQSFNSFASAAGTNPLGGSGTVLAAQPATTAYSQNGARATYVHSHVKAYYSSTGTSAVPGGAPVSTAALQSLIQSNLTGATFNSSTASVQNFVTGQCKDIHSFFDLVIADLLTALKDLVTFALNGIEDVIIELLQLIGDAITTTLAIWTKNYLDIPIISWLYKYVITGTVQNPGDDLSILDALCLVIAVPTTILYKILVGKGTAPFTSADAENVETNGLPWPQFGGASTLAVRPQLTATAVSGFMERAGAFAGVANFAVAAASGFADYLAFQPTPWLKTEQGLVTFVSISTLVSTAAAQVLSAPFNLFTGGPLAEADRWTIAEWSVSCLPFFFDFGVTCATGELPRFLDEYGPALDTCAGAVMIIVAGITAHKQGEDMPPYTGWDQANTIVPQIGRLFKFLIMTKDSPETMVVTMPLLLVLDGLLGLGSVVTQVGAAIDG